MKIDFDFGCVYFFKSIDDELLYIGKTYNLKNRLQQHLSEAQEWKEYIYYVEYMVIQNEVDRDIIELHCINLYKPIYNKDRVFRDIKPTIQIELPKKEKVLKTDITLINNKKKINDIKTNSSFKKCCVEYINNPENRLSISKIHPLIKEAHEKLGFDKMRALQFSEKIIKNQIGIDESLINLGNEITNILNFEAEQLLDKSVVKKNLQEIYKVLNIKKVAKATDLAYWYTIKDHNKKIDGRTLTKIKIISCNIKK